MKKYILKIITVLFISITGIAQNISPVETTNNFSSRTSWDRAPFDSAAKKKWSLNSYKVFSTGITAWRGGYATFVSAPIGIQLSRAITNNVYAFAGVSIAPTYINLRQNFMNADFSKTGFSNSFMRSNNFGLYPRAEVGLGYTNDAHTFQISGSIGIQKDPIDYRFAMPANQWNGPGMLRRY